MCEWYVESLKKLTTTVLDLNRKYMKKILVALFAMVALSAYADGWHRHGGSGYGLFPLIIGGVIGYEVGKHNDDRREEQQYRREEQPPQRGVVIDGVVYVEVLQYDQGCNCYRKVLVPKQ